MIKRFAWLLVICCWLLSSQVYATQWLRQSTAVTVKMGPFLDSTNGDTEEESLTISQADIRLSKNGGAYAQTNNSAGATHDENGLYGVPLNTTDTATLGRLKVYIHESGALAVWETFMIVPANVWDSLFGSDILHTSLYEIDNAGSDQSVDDLEDFADAGYDPATNKVTGVLLTDTTTASTNAETAIAAVKAETVLIVADTGELQVDDIPGKIATLDTVVDGVETKVDTAITDIAAVKSETAIIKGYTDDIGAAGAGLTAVVWNTDWDAEVESEVDDALGGGTGTALSAVPWNSNWDAEVQSEVADAIVVYKLDHLVYAADGDDPADNSIMAMLAATGGDWSTFVKGTDSLQAQRDQGDSAWITATTVGLSNDAITAAKVHAGAWQELIELLFDYDATATYATANAGSLVKQIGSNATVTIPPRIE